jgi:hypothetical protein
LPTALVRGASSTRSHLDPTLTLDRVERGAAAAKAHVILKTERILSKLTDSRRGERSFAPT